MARIESWFEQDLKKPVVQRYISGNFFSLDNVGNLVGVKVYDNGAEATLSGSVTGYCILADGTTVPVVGTRSGNQAYIILPQSVLTIPGHIGIALKLIDGSAITTLLSIVATVYQSRTDAEITPSPDVIEEWSSAISAALQEVEDVSAGVENSLAEMREEMSGICVKSENVYNPGTDRHGKNFDSNTGVVSDDANYKISDYIYVGPGNYITVKTLEQGTFNGALKIGVYTEANESSYSRGLYATGNSQTLQLASTEKYVVLSMYNASEPFMANIGTTLLPYKEYGSVEAGYAIKEVLDGIDSRFHFINLFDKESIIEGKYVVPSTGGLSDGSGFFASDFIDVSKYSTIKVSKTHLFALYDDEKEYVSAPENTNSISNDLTVDVSDAAYIRFSTYDEYLDSAQIGDAISATDYVPFGKYDLPGLVTNPGTIVVDKSGNGDYTSLTQALYENVNSRDSILVKAGTYDIVSEYETLFGQSAVDSMADSDNAVFNGFQFGLILRNRKIEFAPGAHIVCDWTGHTVDGTHRFCALRVETNVEIVGLDLDATATFYAIHDDYGLAGEPYTVKYENCRVVGHSLYNSNCIGGGCKPYSRHIINNCYFDNNLNSAVVRYHNTNASGAEPEIYVSNSYFNSVLSFNYYGTQTSKMRAYVNNCKAKAIQKAQESQSFSVDNVELIKWCCEEDS